jgi:hypothetical protein
MLRFGGSDSAAVWFCDDTRAGDSPFARGIVKIYRGKLFSVIVAVL